MYEKSGTDNLNLLLDTNVVIHFLKGDKASLKLIRKSSSLAISFITEIELLCYEVDIEEEKNIKKFISNVHILFPNYKTTKYTIDIRKNTGMKLPDSIIAAQARQFNLILATCDKELLKKAESYEAINP